MEDYFSRIGLQYTVPSQQFDLESQVKKVINDSTVKIVSTQQELDNVFTYTVPIITEPQDSEVCSKLKDPIPFNLATRVLGLEYNLDHLKTHSETQRILKLQEIIRIIQSQISCDWIGIYRLVNNLQFDDKTKYDRVLIKEAYFGSFSRADFPVTEEFSKRSTNSLVALKGKAKLIQDVHSHDGPYYQCDVRVQSELCVPIFHNDNVIGIIDAEAHSPQFFSKDDRIYKLVATCKILGDWNLGY